MSLFTSLPLTSGVLLFTRCHQFVAWDLFGRSHGTDFHVWLTRVQVSRRGSKVLHHLWPDVCRH